MSISKIHRFPDDVWAAVEAKAKELNITPTEVVMTCIRQKLKVKIKKKF